MAPPRFDPELEKVAGLFLRAAPTLVQSGELGIASAPVDPWPHQLRTVRRTVERFPQGFLFCDEVGLGKTVEALLALRQLVLAGRVRRALILVPKALLRQWQEELHEKAALDVPRFDNGRFWALDDSEPQPADPQAASLWERFPLILASTQAVRRAARRDELLRARGWDLVIVDEAHHARRSRGGRPNKLLELLRGGAVDPGGGATSGGDERRPGLRDRARCLYLLTATPMQVAAVELWDLLGLVGLGGAWGAREHDFLRFFEELRRPWEQRDHGFLRQMAADALRGAAAFADLDRLLGDWSARLPAAARDFLQHLQGETLAAPALPDESDRAAVEGLLRALTPIRFLVWRATRKVLRGQGAARLPERFPDNVWVELGPAPRALYDKIDAYLAAHYQRFEAQRPGLGFIMTVYRRRLTSSFAAITRSLERRRAFVAGRLPAADLLDPLEDEDPDDDERVDAVIEGEKLAAAVGELAEIDGLLVELGRLEADAKLLRLEQDLDELLQPGRYDRALVFTQYFDTLDALRERLAATGRRVACYSGRGGERREAGGWSPWPKETLKAAFAAGEIEVLVCTDAASEGLNLQTCGLLINFDMPWNPMRVEQRIGRIDRLGQVHPRIEVRNYFYRDTVEAEIYRRLAARIEIFQDVVGPLQPILHRVGESLRRLAMLPAAERERELARDVDTLTQAADDIGPDPLAFPEFDADPNEPPPVAPIDAAGIENLVLACPSLAPHFERAEGEAGRYRLDWGGRRRDVTFDPALYARQPYGLELLTWGNRTFAALLASLPEPATAIDAGGVALYAGAKPAPVALFLGPDGPLGDWPAIEAALRADRGRPWPSRQEGEASSRYSRARLELLRGMTRVETGRRQAERSALEVAAARLLAQWALLELKEAETPSLFEPAPSHGFGREVVAALVRHGEPATALLAIAEGAGELPEARADDPYYLDLSGRSPGALQRRRRELLARARDLRARWQALLEAEEDARLSRSEAGIELRRRYFRPGLGRLAADASDTEPTALSFENAVPLYDDFDGAARRLLAALAEGREPQQDARENPGAFTWLPLAGRRPSPQLFAAPLPEGGHGLFRLDHRLPAGHQRALVHHPELGPPRLVHVRRAGQTLLLQDGETRLEADADLVVIAHLLETLD